MVLLCYTTNRYSINWNKKFYISSGGSKTGNVRVNTICLRRFFRHTSLNQNVKHFVDWAVTSNNPFVLIKKSFTNTMATILVTCFSMQIANSNIPNTNGLWQKIFNFEKYRYAPIFLLLWHFGSKLFKFNIRIINKRFCINFIVSQIVQLKIIV